MKNHVATTALRSCAGLLVGAGLWALNTQLGEILPYADCSAQIRWSTLASFVAAAITILAGIASWRIASNSRTRDKTSGFMGSVSGLAALIFTFAVAMQGVASLMLSGCEK